MIYAVLRDHTYWVLLNPKTFFNKKIILETNSYSKSIIYFSILFKLSKYIQTQANVIVSIPLNLN